MADDREYREAHDARVSSARKKADWESRNRNFYGGEDRDDSSGAGVSREMSRTAGDIARINARRAGAERKIGKRVSRRS